MMKEKVCVTHPKVTRARAPGKRVSLISRRRGPRAPQAQPHWQAAQGRGEDSAGGGRDTQVLSLTPAVTGGTWAQGRLSKSHSQHRAEAGCERSVPRSGSKATSAALLGPGRWGLGRSMTLSCHLPIGAAGCTDQGWGEAGVFTKEGLGLAPEILRCNR